MDQQLIYRHHADRYHELVCAEDCDHNLLQILRQQLAEHGNKVIEIGAGTGRLTKILLEQGANVVATEPEVAMLTIAEQTLLTNFKNKLCFLQAEAENLPVESKRFDIAIAGWVFGHFRTWMPEDWQEKVFQALQEMRRVVRPHGRLIIIETMGTGQLVPAPPNPALAEFYNWLQQEHGFTHTVIATDYNFSSVDEAARVLGFFFGEKMALRVRTEQWKRVPEWTGIWIGG